MNRLTTSCCGDCAVCKLLANGEVDMIPCILDQLFRKVQRLEEMIEEKKLDTLAAEVPKRKTQCVTKKPDNYVQEDD